MCSTVSRGRVRPHGSETRATCTSSGAVLLELYDAQPSDYANRLVNVSARNQVGTGANALIVGFVIAGSGSKQLLIRGVGPKLASFGVTGALADPYLEIFDSAGNKVGGNDNWDASLAISFVQAGAFALDAGSKDAALLITLPTGVYSAKLTGVGNGTGEGLVEVYEIGAFGE
ncbi:MAG: repeat protein [Verrucomicrobia bacterium]|nr:repeat protein [Verrucomicrobiota bacterium]